nr:rasGAP-activating-like protein 1 [Danio rerio]|eukprot:XP_021334215.1 rasGAP-activating-like protein 1 [Danio rerio]
MARNTSLYFRIVEGKNLPAKDVSGTSDPYCIVKVDNEVVARTATVWKNLNPFWGEEYTLHLPMGFHTLTFYVMDEDTIGHDDVIGKISLSKDVIAAQHKGLDNWLNLTRVDPDEEVQGEIHLALELQREKHRSCLSCHIIEARDLAPRDITGTSDPFTRIIYNNLSAETSIIKKTRFPHWDETLELCLDEADEDEGGMVTVEVWDWDMVGKNDFLGKVEIPLSCLLRSPVLQGWFRLMPLGNTEDNAGGKLGALRLKVRLVEERILPSVYYQPLMDLLVEAVISPSEVDEATTLTLLEEVTTVDSRQDVAMTLVKLYLGQGLVVPFLDYLNTREVHSTTDPNTLFRSNSLASKAMEQFMKVQYMCVCVWNTGMCLERKGQTRE